MCCVSIAMEYKQYCFNITNCFCYCLFQFIKIYTIFFCSCLVVFWLLQLFCLFGIFSAACFRF